jgi:limonene-1,2-epoxide hydrolase
MKRWRRRAKLGEPVFAEENIATVRRVADALVRRDYEAAAANLSPDFQVDDTDIPESTGRTR